MLMGRILEIVKKKKNKLKMLKKLILMLIGKKIEKKN